MLEYPYGHKFLGRLDYHRWFFVSQKGEGHGIRIGSLLVIGLLALGGTSPNISLTGDPTTLPPRA